MNPEEFQRLVEMQIQKAGSQPLILLESQMPSHPSSRYSILGSDPNVILTARGNRVDLKTADLEADDLQRKDRERQTEILKAKGAETSAHKNPWEVLKQIRREKPGWYLGYLGYDLKNHIERLDSRNPDPVDAPDLFFFRPGTLLIYDHQERKLLRQANETGDLRPVKEAEWRSALSSFRPGLQWKSEHQEESPQAENQKYDPENTADNNLKAQTDAAAYLEKIEKVRELIRNGECYEVNLSHLLQGSFSSHPYELYRRMRQIGPVPFAAYMQWEGYAICSASPERFLSKEGPVVRSQPIKGTAAREKDEAGDEEAKKSLMNSAKERAENLMIVDLVRHDLSKLSLQGTVRVPELFSIQSFETVHQLISTVESRVGSETDPVDILRSCFPMGSMTGAPKIRAMEIIEELEEYKRGIYSGAVGYLKPNDDFDFNVVIRTAIMKGTDLFYPVGGAITFDSNPEKELEETWIKARALTRAAEFRPSMK